MKRFPRAALAALTLAVGLLALAALAPLAGCSGPSAPPAVTADVAAPDADMAARIADAESWADIAADSAASAKEILFAVRPDLAADWAPSLNAAEVLARQVKASAATATPETVRNKRWWATEVLRVGVPVALEALKAARG